MTSVICDTNASMLGLSCISIAFHGLLATSGAPFDLIEQLVRHCKVAFAAHDAEIRLISAVIIAAAGDQQALSLSHLRINAPLIFAVTAVDRFDAVESMRCQLDEQLLDLFKRRQLQLIGMSKHGNAAR